MFTIGKTFKFNSAHFLPGHKKCGKVHGHTYHLTVEISADLVRSTGMVLDLHLLSQIVNSVIKPLDHDCINEILPEMLNPTCENLAEFLQQRIYKKVSKLLLRPLRGITVRVKIQEGDGGYAIYES